MYRKKIGCTTTYDEKIIIYKKLTNEFFKLVRKVYLYKRILICKIIIGSFPSDTIQSPFTFFA